MNFLQLNKNWTSITEICFIVVLQNLGKCLIANLVYSKDISYREGFSDGINNIPKNIMSATLYNCHVRNTHSLNPTETSNINSFILDLYSAVSIGFRQYKYFFQKVNVLSSEDFSLVKNNLKHGSFPCHLHIFSLNIQKSVKMLLC